jgi:hypothetical protein
VFREPELARATTRGLGMAVPMTRSGCGLITTPEWKSPHAGCVLLHPASVPPRLDSANQRTLDFRLGLGRELGMRHVTRRYCYFGRRR